MPIRLTRELAFAASLDAGNRSMHAAQRSSWNEEDAHTAAAEFNRLWPLCPHGIDPESYCWLCEQTRDTPPPHKPASTHIG